MYRLNIYFMMEIDFIKTIYVLCSIYVPKISLMEQKGKLEHQHSFLRFVDH